MSIQSWSTSRRGRIRFGIRRRGVITRRLDGPLRRRHDRFRAALNGLNQVPPVLTAGSGTMQLIIHDDGPSIEYELTYSNVSTPARAAHIHFGHTTDNGGIIAFLCGGSDKGLCPGEGGTITGKITSEDILEIPEQGVAAGNLAAVIRLIRSGLVYVNVHTANFPNGEIRGQLRPS